VELPEEDEFEDEERYLFRTDQQVPSKRLVVLYEFWSVYSMVLHKI
jgi:hypothetical protein